jgi:signal transduction histidine kinase
VTHEIRTPLSALAVNLQLLRRMLDRQTFQPEEATRLLVAGGAEVDRINRAIEEFVRYSRPPKPRPVPLRLGDLAQQVVDLLRARAEQAGVRLWARSPRDLPEIAADPDQLREVVINLVANALDAMPDGGEGGVDVLHVVDGGRPCVALRVTDSGPGVPAEALPRIFEPFFTTKDRGLGLGLAIASRIVEQHGGTLRCHSRHGGSAFEMLLPLPVPSGTQGAGRGGAA